MANTISSSGNPSMHRFAWPILFLAVNLVGLATIVWRIEAGRAPGSTMTAIRRWPTGETRAEYVSDVGIEFGTPLDPSTVRPDTIRLAPPVPGKTELSDERTLVFQPSEKLRDATRYEVLLDPALRGKGHETPPAEKEEFFTQRLTFTAASQAALEPDGTYILELDFSTPVDPDALAKHLKLTYPNGNSVKFERMGDRPSPTLRIRCPKPAFDTIIVEVAAGLAGTEGPLGTDGARRIEVGISKELRLVSMHADFSGENGDPRGRLHVNMNASVDIDRARPFVAIDPPMEFTLDPDSSGFDLLGDFRCGRRYHVTLKPGLSAGIVQPLATEIKRTIWVPDKPRDVRFGSNGGYLTASGLLKVPLVTTNVERLELSVERLYPSNIVEHVLERYNWNFSELGTHVCRKEIQVSGRRNERTETLVDLREFAGADPRGVWRLRLGSPETEPWRHDWNMIVVTGLGASARIWEKHAMVWVTTLDDARPAEGVQVTVYSDHRQPMGTAVTDPEGLAVIDLAKTPKDEEAAIVVLQRGGELSYLSLSGTETTHEAECYRGRPFVSRGYEVFGFTERGAYRPGDDVRLSGFLRAPGLATPPEMPLDLVILKPGGNELLRKAVPFDATGRSASEIAIPKGVPTGGYRAQWRLPGSASTVGEAFFMVSDYLPRTLRVALESPEGPLPADQPVKVAAIARQLFGDPASGLEARCRATFIAETFASRDWKDYAFGDLRIKPGRADSDAQASRLDAEGKASFEIKVPALATPAVILANVEVEVREPGGRALTERITRRVHPWKRLLGTKPPGKSPLAGEPAAFAVVVVDPEGRLVESPRGYAAALYRVSWSSVLEKTDEGRFKYDWKRHEEPAGMFKGDLTDGKGEIVLAAKNAGSYRLVVESEDSCPSVCDFQVQGPGAEWASEDPETLQMTLDKAVYKPGDVAKLSVRGPFGGTALVCVETDRVIEKRLVPMAEGDGVLEFTVDQSWRPNVYLTIAIVRPVRAEEEWRPHRAGGAVCLKVDNDDRRLAMNLVAPRDIRPGDYLEVKVGVSADGMPRQGAAVVLAAVDEGVLSLTDFPTPDPWDFFYSTRRLGVRGFDMYGLLAPELAAWKLVKAAVPGGDEGPDLGAELARRLNSVDARRVKTAALWTGTLVTGEDGMACARFPIPEYVGELRIMAAAASDDRFGSSSQPLTVRSPLMARPSWPRFVAPGDEFDLPVTIYNRTPEGGKVALDLELSGPLQTVAAQPVLAEVPAGGERTVVVRLRAVETGKAEARLTAKLGAESYSESVELPVRPACSFARRAGSAVIEAGKETRVAIAGDLQETGSRCRLVVAGNPTVELAGAIDYLLQYPYGCAEQTISRLVPLIYLRELAAQTCEGMVGSQEIDEIMRAGIMRLRMMQTYGGALGMWPGGGDAHPWASIYAADILTEARKAGHEIPDDVLDPLMQYLENSLGAWATGEDRECRTTAAYAAYVLARAGKPPYAWLARLEEILKADDIPATAKFHLGAAILAAGQSKAAREFIGDVRPGCTARRTGGDFDSPAREAAILLLVLLDVDPESAQVPALAERLRRSITLGRWGTTQENAFALMALGKYARRLASTGEVTGTATLPDGTTRRFTSREGLTLPDLRPGQTVVITAEGKGKLWAFWDAEGIPRDGKVPEGDSGLKVRRTILDRKGNKPIDAAKLVQGEIYTIKLAVTSPRALENLVITDLLPAGLEIENPDLRGSATVETPQAPPHWNIRHVERRDDRMLIFGDLFDGTGEYAYAVRAVTAGWFVLPAADAACMYDPGAFSVNGAGTVEVVR